MDYLSWAIGAAFVIWFVWVTVSVIGSRKKQVEQFAVAEAAIKQFVHEVMKNKLEGWHDGHQHQIEYFQARCDSAHNAVEDTRRELRDLRRKAVTKEDISIYNARTEVYDIKKVVTAILDHLNLELDFVPAEDAKVIVKKKEKK